MIGPVEPFYPTLMSAWTGELKLLLEREPTVSPRGMQIRESIFRSFSVVDPTTFPFMVTGRNLKHVVGLLEGLSNVGQVSVPEMYTDRIQNFLQFEDDGIFYGAYGGRLHGQIGDLVQRFREDPDTRQGVLSIYDGTRDLSQHKRDIPCTVSVQFLMRNGRLHMHVNMRSNDIWLGTPYDLVQFSILQLTLAQALDLAPGCYRHTVGSLHLYERDVEKARQVEPFETIGTMPFPLWRATELQDIVRRARRILAGQELGERTAFEQWAHGLLWESE